MKYLEIALAAEETATPARPISLFTNTLEDTGRNEDDDNDGGQALEIEREDREMNTEKSREVEEADAEMKKMGALRENADQVEDVIQRAMANLEILMDFSERRDLVVPEEEYVERLRDFLIEV